MSVQPLHRDEVDGNIVLIRMPGDCWRVARHQKECDWVRSTEKIEPTKRRFGLCGSYAYRTQFVRVTRVAGGREA